MVQLIPQITQSDLPDSEMASNVVYPLKLFKSMFSNNGMLLWLLFFFACAVPLCLRNAQSFHVHS